MFLSLHMPKTAGTSFRMALQERFGTKMLLSYRGQMRGEAGGVPWRSTSGVYRGRPPVTPYGGTPLLELDEAGRAALAEYCRVNDVQVIHGHFELPPLLEALPDARAITFLRDPVERLISSYNHWHLTKPEAAQRTPFEVFLHKPKTINMYEQHGMLSHLESLSFIGITEQYDRSLRLLERMFPELGYLHVEEQNVSKKRVTKADVTPEMRARIIELNDGDLMIYAAAKEWFEKACTQYGV
jgi:hypothetical protein